MHVQKSSLGVELINLRTAIDALILKICIGNGRRNTTVDKAITVYEEYGFTYVELKIKDRRIVASFNYSCKG